MSNAEKIMGELVEVARALSQTKRKENLVHFKSIAILLGLDPEQYNYLARNVAAWPDRLARDSTELKYLVDFAYDNPPDHGNYVATFEEVAKLLKYTPGSCRVAFNSSPDKKVDRTRRPTRLGPCMVIRLDEPVDPAHPQVKRLSEREELKFPKPKVDAKGRVLRARGRAY